MTKYKIMARLRRHRKKQSELCTKLKLEMDDTEESYNAMFPQICNLEGQIEVIDLIFRLNEN